MIGLALLALFLTVGAVFAAIDGFRSLSWPSAGDEERPISPPPSP